MLLLWALLSAPLLGLGLAQQGEPCPNTLSGQPGRCVNIYNCSSVVVVLREQKPLSQDAIKRLQSTQCGFTGTIPKVCCADHLPAPTAPPTTKRPPRPGQSTARPPTNNQLIQQVPNNHPKLRLLPLDSCGVETSDKIVNGRNASIGQMPWMARLGYETRFGESYRCGASVINKRYVLTAAHCMKNLPNGLKLVSVLLGELNANTDIDCENTQGYETCNPPTQSFGVAEAIAHPQYSPTTVQNDIGLIRLDRDADFSVDSVRPICLPVGNAQLKNLDQVKALRVAGWGTTENGSSSPYLLFADVPPVTNARCKEIYQKQAPIIDAQICAGGSTQDSCDGDSGGPLITPDVVPGNPSARWVQVGIVSFGPVRCGTKNQPGVYTRAGHYLSWILENIKA